MSTTPQATTTRTIVVPDNQALIPDENATAYCLTRRNVFDTIIALLIVIGIIYFVIESRKGSRMGYETTGLFDFGSSTGTGTGMGMGAATAAATGMGAEMNRMGTQVAGALKKWFA